MDVIRYVISLWMQISGTRADIQGLMHFKSNDGRAVDAGALYVTSYGQLQLQKGANMVFESNTGMYVIVSVIMSCMLLMYKTCVNNHCISKCIVCTNNGRTKQDHHDYYYCDGNSIIP